MSFVRSKEISPGSGHWYDYEVTTTREGSHVRQKVIRYIGRSATIQTEKASSYLGRTLNPDWSLDELEYIADNIGWLSYDELAEGLRVRYGVVRTHDAIRTTRCRRKMPSLHRNANCYTCTQLAEVLGVARTTVLHWHRRGLLGGKYATWRTSYNKRALLFQEDDIITFLHSPPPHVRLLLRKRIQHPYFMNILKEGT
jgi:hypothetical protein